MGDHPCRARAAPAGPRVAVVQVSLPRAAAGAGTSRPAASLGIVHRKQALSPCGILTGRPGKS